jgi:ABC-type multidrug transport system ATPase subunit
MKQRFGIARALIGDPKLIIVDEPTAGVDPEERVRFHNLLSEIGEHVVVILSTHIVSDVSDLCRSMAIINLGRVLVEGDPLELARSLRGRIWQKLISRTELAAHKEGFTVLSSRQDYAGEDNVNRALRDYVQAVAYRDPPYTNSVELIDRLRKIVPAEYSYIIHDMFETITLY